MADGAIPTGIGCPALPEAVVIGVTVPDPLFVT